MLLAAWLACHPEPGPGHHGNHPPPPPDTTPTVDGLHLEVDPDVVLIVRATFTPPPSADDAWVEYRAPGGAWTPAQVTAPGTATVLGIPEATLVEARVASVVGGATRYGDVASVLTGDLPYGLLEPVVETFRADLASPEPWAMISVATGNFTYEGPYYVEIFDRDGRVVWYHEVPEGLFCFQPTVARDGTHIWFEGEDIFGFSPGAPRVRRQTLDGRWSVELPVPDLGQAIAEGPTDAFFYELRRDDAHGVSRLDADGTTRVIWDCEPTMAALGLDPESCWLNTCAWDPQRNTILASQFETSTVFEIDASTGTPLRQMGQLGGPGAYAFDPPSSEWAYQHYPHWTEAGTLLVSTHAACAGLPDCDRNFGQPGIQLAAEYDVDEATRSLTLVSTYESTDRWATQVGEAYRAPNGNLIQGYGQDGAVREITPDGEIAWEAWWPRDGMGYRVVGHFSLIADLYALNAGR